MSERTRIVAVPDEIAPVELAPGFLLRPLVGRHNGAEGLFTGVVRAEPQATLPYHVHPTDEAITILEGVGRIDVEGRRYLLGPYENIRVPKGVAHQVGNGSADQTALFHVAFPAAAPERTLVDDAFTTTLQPSGSDGFPGRERVVRVAGGPPCELGERVDAVLYFSGESGAEGFSGGYAKFETGARLPCHFHDFDESISIVGGTAGCVVEGSEVPVSNLATALVPRGRCHYFVNRGASPMTMIWVYAGPSPTRTVVSDERCGGS